MKKLLAILSFCALLAPVAHANEIQQYSLTGATFSDGSTLSGNWTIDFTTMTVLSENLISSAYGTYMNNISLFLANTGGQGPSDVYEIGSTRSDDASQFLFVDFSKATGTLWGNLAERSPGNYTSFQGPSGGIVLDDLGTVTVPEPTTIALFGLGLFGFVISRRKSRN
jgi:hypothetical protein